MTKSYLAAALATVLLATGAYAQAPATPATPSTPPTTAAPSAGATTLVLVPADATKLRDWITSQKTASVPMPAGFTATVGATLPTTVVLHPIPATTGVSAVGTNQYAVVGDKMVLVNPTDRKIVYVFS
jgi:hypothetical protein